jgi:hypothetical protein
MGTASAVMEEASPHSRQAIAQTVLRADDVASSCAIPSALQDHATFTAPEA